MKIEIEGKTFELKFGFKCLRILGDHLGLASYNETISKLALLDNMNDGNINFEQSDLLEALIESAAEAHPKYCDLDYSIKDVSVIDQIFNDPASFIDVIEGLRKSFPQEEKKAKAQPKPQKAKA